MRCKFFLIPFLLSLIFHIFLFAQDPSSTDGKTETTPSQEVEKSDNQDKGDISKEERKEDVVVEDVIIEEGTEEDIIEEEDISGEVVTEEDIVEEAAEQEVVKEEELEKGEPKEEVVTEQKPKEEVIVEEEAPVKEKPVEEVVTTEEEKIDTVKLPTVLQEEETVKEIKESVEAEKSTGVEKDTAVPGVSVEEEDMDIILEEDEDLLIVDDDEEHFITEEPEETTVVEEGPIKEEEDTVTAEILPSEKAIEEQRHKEGGLVSPEIIETEGEVVGERNVATGAIPGKGRPSEPVRIERARSIDFAKNLKDYRSPKKAMFMSLLLPGLGQAYTKKYWKTALFGAIEASLIGFSIKHAVDGRDKKRDAQRFADQHFNVDTFFTFYEDFEQIISPESIDVDIYMIFDTLSKYKKKFTPEKLDDFESSERQDFDDAVGNDAFVQGWDDCEPSFNATGFDISDSTDKYYFRTPNTTDSIWVLNMYEIGSNTLINYNVFGYSKNQTKYREMISLSDHYYKVSTILIFFIVANHVASAVDAFISARAFNDKLLHKESLWQRITIDHHVAFAPNDFRSQLGIRVRF